MNTDPYIQITRDLLAIEEFRIGLETFRGLLLVGVAFLALLSLLHVLYYLGVHTPLYRRRAPVKGWNRRFFASVILLSIVILLISWGSGLLLKHMV